MAPEQTGRRRRGSITLLALCLTAAMAIALASYLAIYHRSQQFGVRQTQNDKVRELAQVGLEEALWALNQNNWAASGPANNGVWDTTADAGATRKITLSYPMPAQGMSGRVELTITQYSVPPTTSPRTSAVWPTIVSKATLTLASGEVFTKTLQASTTIAPLFGNAIASADSYVTFVERGYVDSWNSNPSYSPTGPITAYVSPATPTVTNYNAVVAGRTNGSYGVVLTQAEVHGYASTFGLPISTSTSGSPPGKVRGLATAAAVNVDPLRVGKSAFVPTSPVFSINTPTTGDGPTLDLLAGLAQLVIQLLNALLNVIKVNSDLKVDGTALYPDLTITRPIKLVVNGNLNITTGILGARGQIVITSTGSLELFVNGDITIGADGFDNQTNDPKKLAIYSTGTTNTAIRYSSTESFCGVIYSEKKPITVSSNAAFSGALLSRGTIQFTSNATPPTPIPTLHYDVALRKTIFPSVKTPYLVSQVTEP